MFELSPAGWLIDRCSGPWTFRPEPSWGSADVVLESALGAERSKYRSARLDCGSKQFVSKLWSAFSHEACGLPWTRNTNSNEHWLE